MSAMTTAKCGLLVTSVLLAAGCFEAPALPAKLVDRKDLVGAYSVTYANVEQWLALRADGTYAQHLLLRSGERLNQEGRWQLSDDRETLSLENPIMMRRDPFTIEPPQRIKGVWSLAPYRSRTSGKVFLLISSNFDLAFEKRNGQDVPAALTLETGTTSSG